MADYFNNFGFELKQKYVMPYLGQEHRCPYSQDTELRRTGYIRADLRNKVEFTIPAWPMALWYHGPLMINMRTVPNSFRAYAGGVYDEDAPDGPSHSFLLVGHGRENGHEYWLVRNSFGRGWGEQGHMKLAKRAHCIWPLSGLTFGSDDGIKITVTAYRNPSNRPRRGG